jgi:alginate O-acetyltransferase complex protein AlgI
MRPWAPTSSLTAYLPVGISFFHLPDHFLQCGHLSRAHQAGEEHLGLWVLRELLSTARGRAHRACLGIYPTAVRAVQTLQGAGRIWAVFWIFNGLLKKLFLADYLAVQFIDRVFDNPQLYSGFETMSALFGYSLQVYADFSGYTDVAIGIAMLMGFTLPKNFNSPYKATSVSDFWRRWHLSLSTWLRDYLYIPLGGNREGSIASYTIVFAFFLMIALIVGSPWLSIGLAALFTLGFVLMRYSRGTERWVNTNINLMLTMVLGGLWHGSSWNFVTWGTLNGVGLVVYKNWKKISPWADKSKATTKPSGWPSPLVFITFTRAWFRSPTWEGAIGILSKIPSDFGWDTVGEVLVANWKFYVVLILGYLIHWIPSEYKEKMRNG